MCSYRCNICTGCGKCAGVKRGMNVITRFLPVGEWEHTGSLENESGRRLAVADIGTTTIAMQLYGKDKSVQDEFVRVNPQTDYGADVISRIQAAEDPEKAGRMRDLVREVLCLGLRQFLDRLEPEESLYLVIAANTTMTYLLMGHDPSELGRAPFQARHLGAERIVLTVGDVPVSGVVMPGLSAFVGGDITAGIHAVQMAERERLTLLIDLGTNGELALGNRHRIIACATAAGPAFEGGVNRGVWGADMIHLLAELKKRDILDETGLLADPYFDEGILIGGVRVTQAAVRAVQLAKGAILAGIHILAKEYGAELKSIERVILAGGFGYYLQPEDAAVIGLLPKSLAERAVAGGNTALLGAARAGEAILCGGCPEDFLEKKWEREGCLVEIRNLAEYPEFDEWYLQSMSLQEF